MLVNSIDIHIEYTHWIPIITFCPVNNLPDFVYVRITAKQELDLYKVRKRLRKNNFKKKFMEDIARDVFNEFSDLKLIKVELTLLFNRHKVIIKKKNNI